MKNINLNQQVYELRGKLAYDKTVSEYVRINTISKQVYFTGMIFHPNLDINYFHCNQAMFIGKRSYQLIKNKLYGIYKKI